MHFVIAGKVNCPQFVFASMIAQKLKDNLPDFTYSKISKKSGDWEKWVLKKCKKNDWCHLKSPIIWREIAMTKGKKYFVGDITQFIDLCQDHYGLTREMLSGERFDKAEMEWFAKLSEMNYIDNVRRKAEEHVSYRCRQVCILGAACHASDILIMELLHIPLQNRENGLEIRLYDDPVKEKKLKAIADDAKHSLGYSGLGSCRVAANMKEALYNVDLVIVLDSFPRRWNESLVKWLKRNRNAMYILGNALNKYAKTHCRVIIGSPSNQPICYNATVLASVATKLHVRNIVVVTQDLGRETLAHLAKRPLVNLKDLNCPPVWGFVGLNKYVDVRNTLQTCRYKVPGPHLSMNLSQGTEELEIRTLDPLLDNHDINGIAAAVMRDKEESIPHLGRVTQLAKITAILDLLKVWSLKQEDGNGEILSLGVYSDGTFNIPEGLFWSQPVTLEKGFWKPYARFPIPRRLDINLHSFFVLGVASLAETGVTVRKQRDPKPIRKKKESKKFDLNNLRNAVKLPVVKTKAECLDLLKRLAKEEMDFETYELTAKSLSTITELSEESAIETVPPEKIYCECWRQEILQLRKMATEKPSSSSTEIEVDLFENLSGSEWSVVNPTEPYVPSRESLEKPSSETSSKWVACNCEPECHCSHAHGEASSSKKIVKNAEEKTTEQYYTRQDARVYIEEDSKEVIYEDMYKKKEVRFDPSLDPCAGRSKKKYKFYGTKDAIVDVKKRQEMMRRIKKYERGSEGEGEDDEKSGGSPLESSSFSIGTGEYIFFSPKFHLSIDANYEIVGDPDGLEALEEMRKYGPKESADDFREMWADEVTPALQVLPSGSEKSSGSVEVSTSESRKTTGSTERIASPEEDFGDGEIIDAPAEDSWFKSNLEVIPEVEAEDEIESVSREVGESAEEFESKEPAFAETEEAPLTDTEEAPLTDTEEAALTETEEPILTETESAVRMRKRRGIPKCCFCHCIVPEGELGCHCGETRVMEVFKKESEEVIESDHSGESPCTSSESTSQPGEELREYDEMEMQMEKEHQKMKGEMGKKKGKGEEGEEGEGGEWEVGEGGGEEIGEWGEGEGDEGDGKGKKGKVTVKERKEKREKWERGEGGKGEGGKGEGGKGKGGKGEGGKGEGEEGETEEDKEVEELSERKRRDIFSLPPESFFPFSLKPANKFVPSERPPEMQENSKNILDELPPECLEMMEEAKGQVPEEIQRESDEKGKEKYDPCRGDQLLCEIEDRSVLLEMSVSREYRVEDWTTILKKRYKEWFATAKNVPDDFYYDMAAEEPSDEEFEVDKEFCQYFED